MKIQKQFIFLALAGIFYAGPLLAGTPCDFKGLSVGDTATPQQIMQHFGISKYVLPGTPIAPDKMFLARAKVVGSFNAIEESDLRLGAACSFSGCRIPYGSITVGSEPYPIMVSALISFDRKSIVTSIDVSYDRTDWGEVLALLNTKYGDDWNEQDIHDVTSDYERKKSWLDTVTALKHRTAGKNPKTGDECTITVSSRDIVFLHSTPPISRAILEIKLVSKNF